MRIICLVGMPGSGKTFWANSFQPNKYVIDDIKNLNQLPDKFENLIISDPYFCITSIRNKANEILSKKYEIKVEWIFFENDKEKCKRNVQHRNDGRKVFGLIDQLSTLYEIPSNINPIKIWIPS